MPRYEHKALAREPEWVFCALRPLPRRGWRDVPTPLVLDAPLGDMRARIRHGSPRLGLCRVAV